MTLEGTGILSNSSSCYVYAENFKLLPHSLGRMTVNLTRAHIVLPNVENILKFSEEDLLQSDAIQPVNLQQLDRILEQATSRSYTQGVDVNKIVTTLHGKETERQSTHWLWIIGVVVIFLGVGILWFIWFKLPTRHCLCMWKCPQKPKQPSIMTTTQPLNTHNTELQITREEDTAETTNAEQEASTAEVSRSQVLTTVFVRHGQGVAECQ